MTNLRKELDKLWSEYNKIRNSPKLSLKKNKLFKKIVDLKYRLLIYEEERRKA